MEDSTTLGIPLFAYACELGTTHPGSAAGPQHFIQSQAFGNIKSLIGTVEYVTTDATVRGLEATSSISEINHQLALKTKEPTRFITLGGDHSSAIGTWSGVSTRIAQQGDLGLIWFDAHMDSHTPQTTHSGNIHGMPLAALLGYGDSRLTKILSDRPKIKAENLCLIGVRSFESEEKILLDTLNVRIFYAEEVAERGIKTVLNEALKIATTGTAGFGISFDLDVIDPQQAPAVGTPEPQGLATEPLLEALKMWNRHPALLGLEIAEFTPQLDQDHRTEKLIAELINTLWGSL